MDDDPEQLDKYVEDLLQDRKPERTSLSDEDALRARQAAAMLRAGREVRALSAVCTHMGCLLNWSTFRSEFECPCHGATFDINGEPSGDYSDPNLLRPLPALEVRVVRGTVQVYTV